MEEPNEQKNNSNDWYICCSHSNPETIKCATQVTIALIVLLFSIIQLSVLDNQQDKTIYFSLISTIIGLFIPSPNIKK
jgi:hypothetical protein